MEKNKEKNIKLLNKLVEGFSMIKSKHVNDPQYWKKKIRKK